MKLNANTISLAIMTIIVAFLLFTNTGFDAALEVVSVCLDTLFDSIQKI